MLFGILIYPATLLMPINKKLYSLSFTLLVIAVSGAVLSFFYAIVDILPTRSPTAGKIVSVITAPLKWLGLNPLAVFVLMDGVAIIMGFYITVDGESLYRYFYRNVFASWIDDPAVAATVFASFFVILWTTVAGIMHKFKLYIRL